MSPFLPTGHLEVDLVVAEVRVRLADVVLDAAGAQAGARPAERERVGAGDDADVLEAVDEDAVAEEHRLALGDDLLDLRQHRAAQVLEGRGGRLGHAADATERVGHAGAGLLFEEVPHHLAAPCR